MFKSWLFLEQAAPRPCAGRRPEVGVDGPSLDLPMEYTQEPVLMCGEGSGLRESGLGIWIEVGIRALAPDASSAAVDRIAKHLYGLDEHRFISVCVVRT